VAFTALAATSCSKRPQRGAASGQARTRLGEIRGSDSRPNYVQQHLYESFAPPINAPIHRAPITWSARACKVVGAGSRRRSVKQGAGDTRLRPLHLLVSVIATRAGDVAGREPDLEAADGTVVPKVRARLGRVVTGEHNGHGRAVGIARLRIIDTAAEEVRVVSRSVNGLSVRILIV
jgi:hypothetical protein